MKKYFIAFFAFITLFACGTSLPPEQELQNFMTWNEQFVDEVLAGPSHDLVSLTRQYQRNPLKRKVLVSEMKRLMSEIEKLIKEMPWIPDVSHSDIKELKQTFISISQEQFEIFQQIVAIMEEAQEYDDEKWKEAKDRIEWLEDQLELRGRELERLEKRLKQKYPQK